MNFVNLNASPIKTRNRYKGLFLLGMVFCLGMANAATYYLTSAGASAANLPGSWNTNPAGGGTALSSWTNTSTNDIYNIPVGISGSWITDVTIGNAGAGAQSYTFVIDGSLTITNNDVLTFQGSTNSVTWTVNGTLTLDEEGGNETFKTSNPFGTAYFKFSSGATLISNNANGISGINNSIFGTNNNGDFLFLHSQGANYSFVLTSATTTTTGLNDTLNNLTISTTGQTCNTAGVLAVKGALSITGGTFTLAANTTVEGSISITTGATLAIGSSTLTLISGSTFTHSAGTVSLGAAGSFVINGIYTHSLGTFTISTGSVTVGSTGTLVLNTGVFNMAARTLTCAGTITRTSGSIHYTAGSGTIAFTNTTAKTLPSNMFLRYPANFTLNGAGGITLGGNTRAAATDSLGVVTFTSGNLTLTSGITAIGSISGSGGNIVGNATATLTFYGAATNTLRMNQTTAGTTNSVSVLTLNGASNLTLGSNLDVKTTLTLNARTLNLDSFTLTKTGTFTNGTATVQLSKGTFNISGAYTHVSTGTLTFGSGTLSVGSLTMTSGNINVSTGTLSIAGAVSRASGQIHAPSGTVRFTNSSAVTLPSNTFVTYPANFTLNGAGGVTLGGKSGTLKDSLGNLTFTSGNLTVTTDTTCIGSITGSGGSIVGNASSTVRFYGINSSTLRTSQTTPGTSNAVKNLLLTGSSNVTLGTATRIAADGLVNIPSSTTLNTGGLLTIVSNASGHGRVGTVGGTFTSSSTDSIQLFIPGGQRGYRLFGNPFTSALAISQFMDNATEIDVTGAGGSGNGFTNTLNNNPSAYSYNTSGNSWDAFTSTSQTIGIGAGAHILVRGKKGEGLNGAVYTPSAATLRLAGQFRTGNVVTNLSDAGFGWNLVANPYPSNIDIDLISGGNWSNVNAAIYGYDKVNKTYSSYSKNIGGAVNNLSKIIEMGSSFLAEVTTAGAASITFTEAIKTSASSTVSGNPIFTPKAGRLNQFKINLIGAEASEGIFQDECLLSFGNTSVGTPEFDAQSDAWDLGGEMLNVSIITPKNDYLAINEYPSIEKQTEAIPLNVWSKNNGEYTLSFTEVSPINENTQIWLRDKYKGEVHFIQESPYTFAINDMEESYGANRFELFTVQQSSGLSKTSPKNTMSLFPNPMNVSSNKVSIFIPGEGHEYAKVTMYDLSGRVIYVGKQTKYETNQTIEIPLPKGLSAQTYLMSCETKKGNIVQQIILNAN